MICAECGREHDSPYHPYVEGRWATHDFRFIPAMIRDRFDVVNIENSDEYGSWQDWAVRDKFLDRYAIFGEGDYSNRESHSFARQMNEDPRVVADVGWEPGDEVTTND